MRASGRSLNECSQTLGIAKGTASLWARDVAITEQGQQRLLHRARQAHRKAVTNSTNLKREKYRKLRQQAYDKGRGSKMSPQDALCVGLYWGEGSKSINHWKFSNTDRDAVSRVLAWAVRAGHEGGFSAVVNAYEDSPYSSEEIADFWKKAGISKVTVSRLPSKSSAKKRGKHPFGCCHARSNGNGSWLFSYYEGQLHQLKSMAR